MATAEVSSGPAQSTGAMESKHRSNLSPGTSGVPRGKRLTIDDQGELAYKKTPSSTLTASLQLGLQHSIGSIEPKPRRDILMTDFEVVNTVEFPAAGSQVTQAHKYKDFTFKTYSPEAFRFFREAFGILAEDYLVSLCTCPLREVGNPGASGSLFFLSADDAFIIKTVQKKEAKFLQKLLPGYYLNLTQNKRTLLPKFFGLYRYKCGSVNIRIVVMNNLLPSTVQYHEKYDLKGSTYKRKASKSELTKSSPTCKDLDFMERHEEGISLAADKYDVMMKTVERDCKVLESFGIMDYSLLLGVHNIDHTQRERAAAVPPVVEVNDEKGRREPRKDIVPSRIELSKNFSIISMEDIPLAVTSDEQTTQLAPGYPEGYVRGHLHGDRILIYLGVIDILQSYRLKKKLEHTMKSFVADGNTVSVHNPSYYARRFQDFIGKQVFRREKVRYRTRKNSTTVQMQGRRRGAGSITGRPTLPPTVQRLPMIRQTSNETEDAQQSPVSPPLVEGGFAVTSLTSPRGPADQARFPLRDGGVRHRVGSDPGRMRTAYLPEVPTVEVRRSTGGKVDNSRRLEEEEEEEGRGGVVGREERVKDEGGKSEMSKSTVDEVREGGGAAEEVEFAGNVQGTSTPINSDSPTAPRDERDHSRTFDVNISASVVVEEGVEEKEEDQSVVVNLKQSGGVEPTNHLEADC